MTRRMRLGTMFVAFLIIASCSEGDPLGPEGDEEGVLMIHAHPTWAFLRFDGDVAIPVSVADPTTSEGWDMAFFSTSVMLNGGAAGPGNVVGTCVCQNEGATASAIMGMTSATELPDFESVTAAQIPTEEGAWVSDALDPVIEGWYNYNSVTHVVSAATEKVWYFRTASGPRYAKVRIAQIVNPSQAHAGEVTVEFALQPVGGGEFNPPQTVVLDLSSGMKHLDLETASVVDASNSGWDLSLDGYTIRVNGGVSGTGNAGAVATGESFASISAPPGDITNLYAADTYGGVFSEHPWYRYDLAGNHQIWPVFDVYLIRKGEATYKVQLIGYYNTSGDSRWVSVRYERVL